MTDREKINEFWMWARTEGIHSCVVVVGVTDSTGWTKTRNCVVYRWMNDGPDTTNYYFWPNGSIGSILMKFPDYRDLKEYVGFHLVPEEVWINDP